MSTASGSQGGALAICHQRCCCRVLKLKPKVAQLPRGKRAVVEERRRNGADGGRMLDY
jgi:hypothetical protein